MAVERRWSSLGFGNRGPNLVEAPDRLYHGRAATNEGPMKKRQYLFVFAACCLSWLCIASPALSSEPCFSEVWAYLLNGEEEFFDTSYPISDVGYFGAGIDSSGKLVGLPDRGSLPPSSARVHLVVAEIGNYALTHFCLDPDYPLRDELIVDIALAARPFDGVQIDFEAVGKDDRENFVEFLRLLKAVLGDKVLSVALSARFDEKHDGLGYERIGKLVDRLVVMAYDEHWSTSAPGPVASLDWCAKIAQYAASKVESGKLVMGLPFYGRAWADKTLSRAYKYSSLASLLAEKGIEEIPRQGDIPFIEYSESVNVKVFFEDSDSIASRLELYRSASVRNVAFWRLGQEDPTIWERLAASHEPGESASACAGKVVDGPPAFAQDE